MRKTFFIKSSKKQKNNDEFLNADFFVILNKMAEKLKQKINNMRSLVSFV
jgi:hypothetical protein